MFFFLKIVLNIFFKNGDEDLDLVVTLCIHLSVFTGSDCKIIVSTFPHHRYIPDWFFSKKTSLELSEVARAGTSIALVLDGSEPWIWNNLIGGSGSVDPFLDVPP